MPEEGSEWEYENEWEQELELEIMLEVWEEESL